MTQDLDALPLPVPTHFRNGVLYAFSADQIRADREMVWELAMREAREGWKLVGYVCRPIEWNPRQSETVVKITRRQQSEYGFTHPIYDSPPPKSDEARDAWTPDQIADACVSAEISDSKFESLLLALAAQQKGGEA